MINFTMFKKTLKQNWQPLFWYSITFILYGWLIIAIYPALNKTGAYSQIFEEMPPELMAFFGSSGEQFVFDFENFIGLEYLSFMYPLIIGAFVAAFLSRFFTKEIESGAIANLLIQPVSRIGIFLSKYSAFLLSSVFLSAVALLTLPFIASWYDINVSYQGVWLVFLNSVLFCLAFGGFTVLMSVLFSDRGKALGASWGLLIGSYILWGLGNMNETLADFQWASLFNYWQPVEILSDKIIEVGDIWVLSIFFLITSLLALFWFNKRDISV